MNRIGIGIDNFLNIKRPPSTLSFDGVDDLIILSNPDKLANAPLSIESIFKVDQWGTNYSPLFAIFNGVAWDDLGVVLFRSGTSDNLVFSVSNGLEYLGAGGPYTSLEFGVTNHVVATIDGVNAKLYLNGALVASKPCTIIPTPVNTYAYIGKAGTSYYWNGIIYETRLYHKALTAQEVLDNYNRNITRDGLYGEWILNQGAGTIIKDTSGNNNNGAISGATWKY